MDIIVVTSVVGVSLPPTRYGYMDVTSISGRMPYAVGHMINIDFFIDQLLE